MSNLVGHLTQCLSNQCNVAISSHKNDELIFPKVFASEYHGSLEFYYLTIATNWIFTIVLKLGELNMK